MASDLSSTTCLAGNNLATSCSIENTLLFIIILAIVLARLALFEIFNAWLQDSHHVQAAAPRQVLQQVGQLLKPLMPGVASLALMAFRSLNGCS